MPQDPAGQQAEQQNDGFRKHAEHGALLASRQLPAIRRRCPSVGNGYSRSFADCILLRATFARQIGASAGLGTAALLATASTVMLRVRRTVAAGVRMQAGRAAPIRIGPTVTPPLVVVLSTL